MVSQNFELMSLIPSGCYVFVLMQLQVHGQTRSVAFAAVHRRLPAFTDLHGRNGLALSFDLEGMVRPRHFQADTLLLTSFPVHIETKESVHKERGTNLANSVTHQAPTLA